MTGARTSALVLASFALACQPKAREGAATDTLPPSTQPPQSTQPTTSSTPARPPAGPSAAVAESAGAAAKQGEQKVPAGSPGQQVTKDRPTLPPGMQSARPPVGGKEPVRTVRELLSSDRDVGQLVSVSGQCLGYSKPVAEGMPPRSRSDWQLGDDGVAIYVTGPLPAGCSATGGSTERTTIVARVAQDTMPAMGNREATPRRYLVLEKR
jgi:hypothetical protein